MKPHFLREEDVAFIKRWVPEGGRDTWASMAGVSDRELERRWKAVREAMAKENIQALWMAGYSSLGYLAWFMDVLVPRGWNSFFGGLVFPVDTEMTAVFQGTQFGQDGPTTRWRGAKRLLGVPPSTTAPYAKHYYAELFEKALQPYSNGKIGIVGQVAHVDADYLRAAFPKATFVDATDLVDLIKVRKSEEEWEFIRRSAQMTEEALEAAFAAIRPGMRAGVVTSIAEFVVRKHGITNGSFMYNSAPAGTLAPPHPLSHRELRPGDYMWLLVECPGPGGMFTEIARTAVVGKATTQMQEELDFAIRAQEFTATQLTPGRPCKEVYEAYNKFLRENDRPEEVRLHSHGQGYDLQVERPLIRWDETMCIEKDMNITIHPMYARQGVYTFLCDNFRVRESGPAQRVHTLPQKIFEVG
jgi:Xaa-Pro aminopeptidase